MQVGFQWLRRALRVMTTPAVLFGANAVLLAALMLKNWDISYGFGRFDARHPGWYIEEFTVAFIFAGFAGLILALRRSIELRHEIAARRHAEAAADRLARHDPLTGLPNRRVIQEITLRLIAALRQGESIAAMLLDLDGFKSVNDLYGHAVGDELLCEVARRLRTAVAGHGTVARLGGDEFVMVTPSGIDRDELARIADAIIADLAEPFFLRDRRVCVGASIGIGICPNDASTVSELLHAADAAMYRAKEAGRSTYRFFEPAMDVTLREQAELKMELGAAIAAGQIVPFYQPVVDLSTRNVDCLEVLARWQHPTRGLLAPDKFISLAENMKLITPLTLSLFRRVCVDARDWPTQYRLALNISPTQLPDASLFGALVALMNEAGLAASRLEIELTECSLIKDMQQAARVIDRLKAKHVTVALDDFGTGYSSLYHLRQINFDKIKIDRSFVLNIGRDPRAASYVKAMIGLGRDLNLQTTAEGIEDGEVLAKLVEFGCTFGQGYIFARPLSARDVGRSMRQLTARDPAMHWGWSPTLPSDAAGAPKSLPQQHASPLQPRDRSRAVLLP